MNMMLVHQIAVFCRKHDMAETRFGRTVLNDPRLVGDMRGGRKPRKRTEKLIRQFMEAAR